MKAIPVIALLLASLLGPSGCKGIPDDGRYRGYAGSNNGGALTGLPVTPYDPNAR